MSTSPDSQRTDSITLIPPHEYPFSGDVSTVENKRRFIEAFRTEGSVYHAANVVGIHRTTVYKWLERDAVFATALDDSREDCYDQAETSVFRKALAGDSLLLMFYLKAHRHKFRDKVTIDVEAVRHEIEERMRGLGVGVGVGETLLQISPPCDNQQKGELALPSSITTTTDND